MARAQQGAECSKASAGLGDCRCEGQLTATDSSTHGALIHRSARVSVVSTATDFPWTCGPRHTWQLMVRSTGGAKRGSGCGQRGMARGGGVQGTASAALWNTALSWPGRRQPVGGSILAVYCTSSRQKVQSL
jgi:hypothetical protein